MIAPTSSELRALAHGCHTKSVQLLDWLKTDEGKAAPGFVFDAIWYRANALHHEGNTFLRKSRKALADGDLS